MVSKRSRSDSSADVAAHVDQQIGVPHGRSDDRGADSVDERARIGQSVALDRRAEVVDGRRLGPLDLLDEPDVTAETPEAEDVAQAHPRLAAVPRLVRQGAADDDSQGFVASTKRLSRSRLSSSTISGKWLAVCRYARCRTCSKPDLRSSSSTKPATKSVRE